MTSLKSYYSVADKVQRAVVEILEEHLTLEDMRSVADQLQLGDIEVLNQAPMFVRPAQALWSEAVHQGKVEELVRLLDKYVIKDLRQESS